MEAIRITASDDAKLEEGLRIIVLNGPVEFTGREGVYRVPNYVLRLLDGRAIPYELVNTNAS